MNKRNLLWVIPLITLFFLAQGLFAQCDLSGWRIFIDPGHGGSDPGAIGPTGLQEKFCALDTGLQLRDQLWSIGADVRMSRTSDVFVGLSARANMANQWGAHRFVSIHYNGFSDPSANGSEVFVVPNPSPTTRNLGQNLLNYIVAYGGLRNRGLKFARFTVLVQTAMPAALSESAFITNPYEESLLYDYDFRGTIAWAHADGLCDHLGGFFGPSEEIEDPSRENLSEVTAIPLPHREGTSSVNPTYTFNGTANLLAPKFSPNGHFVAFTQDGFRGLYVVDLADRKPILLTTASRAGFKFSWSPDSTHIAYTARTRNGYSVNLINIKTKEMTSVLSDLDYVVYPEFQHNGDLLIIGEEFEKNAASRFNLSEQARSPELSVIPYLSSADGQVWVSINGARRQLTFEQDALYTDINLSPKKNKILLNVNTREGISPRILDLDRKQFEPISSLSTGRDGNRNIGYQGAWSPEGDQVLISRTQDNGYTYTEADFFLINGARVVRMTDDGLLRLNPDWSVKNQIVYEDGQGGIVVADLAR